MTNITTAQFHLYIYFLQNEQQSVNLNSFNCLLEVEHSGEKIHVLSTVFRHNGELRKFQSSGSASTTGKQFHTTFQLTHYVILKAL
jgi:hypothetical protein